MNNTTRRVSVLLLVGAAFYLGGCGPENLDDPAYLAQLSDNGMINNAAEKEANAGKAAMMKGDKEGCAAGEEQPAKMEMARPAPQVAQLPGRFVRLPSRAVTEPPVVTNSEEDQLSQQDVLIQRDVHVFKPMVNEHLIKKNLMINNKYHTTVINHPTFRNQVAVTSSVSSTEEVLPTTEVTTPTVDYGTSYLGGVGYAGVPFPYQGYLSFGSRWGVRPNCDRYLSGGFYRYCGEPNPVFPVVGPYYR